MTDTPSRTRLWISGTSVEVPYDRLALFAGSLGEPVLVAYLVGPGNVSVLSAELSPEDYAALISAYPLDTPAAPPRGGWLGVCVGTVNTPAGTPASVYVFAPRAPPRTSVIHYAVATFGSNRGEELDRVPRGHSRLYLPQPAVPAVPQETRWTFTADDVPVPVTTAVFVPFRENRRPYLAVAVKADPEVRARLLDAKWLELKFAARGVSDPDGVVTAWRRAHALPLRWRGEGFAASNTGHAFVFRMEGAAPPSENAAQPAVATALLEAVLPSPRPFRDDPTALDGTPSPSPEKPPSVPFAVSDAPEAVPLGLPPLDVLLGAPAWIVALPRCAAHVTARVDVDGVTVTVDGEARGGCGDAPWTYERLAVSSMGKAARPWYPVDENGYILPRPAPRPPLELRREGEVVGTLAVTMTDGEIVAAVRKALG